jgi:hypothetical protein
VRDRPDRQEPTKRVVATLPHSLVAKLDHAAMSRRSVLCPKISDARSRVVTDTLSAFLNPVARSSDRA